MIWCRNRCSGIYGNNNISRNTISWAVLLWLLLPFVSLWESSSADIYMHILLSLQILHTYCIFTCDAVKLIWEVQLYNMLVSFWVHEELSIFLKSNRVFSSPHYLKLCILYRGLSWLLIASIRYTLFHWANCPHLLLTGCLCLFVLVGFSCRFVICR